MYFVSCSTTCFAFGPGSCISRRGSFASCDFVSFNFVSGVAIISSSFKDGQWLMWRDNCNSVSGEANVGTRIALPLVPAVLGRLNLRRRGLAGGRPGRKFVGARGCWRFSFAFPADASVLTIFEDYTMIGEFLTDAIGGSEVAAFAGGLAVRD